ncbi:MAG TPA: hypothetical protein VGR69_02800 [Candidatus Rubrimentiphilum sp.]|nr:hypothetical protein [Candidatus Rubrimentiphilum sp.]
MSGVVVFLSLREALNAGYHIYGRSERGYLARLRTEHGWALALVECAAPSCVGTTQAMDREDKQTPAPPDDSDQNKEKKPQGERNLDDYDKTVADSFPASDPPTQP